MGKIHDSMRRRIDIKTNYFKKDFNIIKVAFDTNRT